MALEWRADRRRRTGKIITMHNHLRLTVDEAAAIIKAATIVQCGEPHATRRLIGRGLKKLRRAVTLRTHKCKWGPVKVLTSSGDGAKAYKLCRTCSRMSRGY